MTGVLFVFPYLFLAGLFCVEEALAYENLTYTKRRAEEGGSSCSQKRY